MKYHDQHVHCYYSEDSKQELEPYIKKAIELGLSYFAISDHLDLDYVEPGYDWVFDIEKEKQELMALNQKYPEITLLQGIEVGYKETALDRLYEYVNGHDFDFINLSIHDFDGIDFYSLNIQSKEQLEKQLITYLELVDKAVNEFGNYDVVCHIDFCFKSCYLIDNSFKFSDYEPLIIKIMKDIIKNDKCFEINTKVQSFVGDEHTKYILNLYKKLGGKNLTISSDAHKVDRLYSGVEHCIELAKEAGFDHLNYFIKRVRYDFPI